jgi:hypothetical protein
MRMILLKDGTEVPASLAVITSMILSELMVECPAALEELIETCRGHANVSDERTYPILDRLGLTQGGRVHNGVRQIVLATFNEQTACLAQPVAPIAPRLR